MKVILLSDVKKQGKKGDIITVKDGYGVYLINNKLAVKETLGSINVLNEQKRQSALKDEELKDEALEIKKVLENMILSFNVKTGKNDQVFGTVSTKQICSELKNKGINIDKKKIKLDNPINTLGITKVEIVLYKDVLASLKIELKK